MDKNNKRVLVSGGAGYIGCVLVPALLRRGYKVRVFDKLIFGANGLDAVRDQIELIQGDICQFDANVLEDIDSVIHLAGLSNDPSAEYNPEANIRINVEGTRNVAEACVAKGIERFVFASSCSLYYSHNSYEGLLDENSEANPTAPYSLSKKKGEELLRDLASSTFCPVFLRKGTVFGFSPRMRYDLVVNTFVKDAWAKGCLTVNGGGEMWRPLVSVDDVADAYIKALELPREKAQSKAFNVLHKNYRILELAHWIKHVLRSQKDIDVDVQYSDSVSLRSYQVSGDLFRENFGYAPSRGISKAVLHLWDNFQQGIVTDFDNPEHYNIRWLTLLDNMQGRLQAMGSVFSKPNNKTPYINAA